MPCCVALKHDCIGPNRVNRAHWPTKENRQFFRFFSIFPVHGKNGLRWPQMGPRAFFPTNPDLANILGRTDFDFENFYFLDFLGSQLGLSLGPAQPWARLGPGLAPGLGPSLGPGLGPPTWARLGPTHVGPAWAHPLGFPDAAAGAGAAAASAGRILKSRSRPLPTHPGMKYFRKETLAVDMQPDRDG